MTVPDTQATREGALIAHLGELLPGIPITASLPDRRRQESFEPATRVVLQVHPGVIGEHGHREWTLEFVDHSLGGENPRRRRLYAIVDALSAGLDAVRYRLGAFRLSEAAPRSERWLITVLEHADNAVVPTYQLFRGLIPCAAFVEAPWASGSRFLGVPDSGASPEEPEPLVAIQDQRLEFLGLANTGTAGLTVQWPIREDWSGLRSVYRFGAWSDPLPFLECSESHDLENWRVLSHGLSGAAHVAVLRRAYWILRLKGALRRDSADALGAMLESAGVEPSFLLATPRQELRQADVMRWELTSAWGLARYDITLRVAAIGSLEPFLEVDP